jgi:hypothetical protein
LVLLACFALAFGQECPENPPCKDNEMACPTGFDEATQCMHPDACFPADGPCPVSCPCKDDEMTCDMGIDEASNCMMPPTCLPLKGGIIKYQKNYHIKYINYCFNIKVCLFFHPSVHSFVLPSVRVSKD